MSKRLVVYTIAGLVALVLLFSFWTDIKAMIPRGSAGITTSDFWEWLRSWDWRTLLFIAAVVVIAGMLLKRPTVAAAIAAVFLLLTWLGPASVDWYNTPSTVRYTAPVQTARTIRTTECPGVAQPVEINFSWKELNPGGRCRLIGDFGGKGVRAKDNQGVFEVVGWPANRHPTHVRAGTEVVYALYSLCPQTTSGRVNWDCSPQ